jgi:beta-mannosidase
MFPPQTPPIVLTVTKRVGPQFNGAIVSEFGCAVMSSSQSMDSILSPCERDFFSSAMYQRNWPCVALIKVYFGNQTFDWDKSLYRCMVAQMLHMVGYVSNYRSENNWAILFWQYNEYWPTGGWGSIETAKDATPNGGNLLGGRWKPLHYALRDHLFLDWFVACTQNAQCYVRRDSAQSLPQILVGFYIVDVQTGLSHQINDNVVVAMEPFSIYWIDLGSSWSAVCESVGVPLSQSVLQISINTRIVTYIHIVPPYRLNLPKTLLSVDTSQFPQVIVSSTSTALNVWLSSNDGQPDQANFMLRPGESRSVNWVLYDNQTAAISGIRAYCL